MKLLGASLRLSATDISNHLGCTHRTNLNRAAAEGWLDAPKIEDPSLQVLFQRGLAHEAAYVEHLKADGLHVVELPSGKDVSEEAGLDQTAAAMSSGAEVITQARLKSGRWFGIADILRKVPCPSKLGAWSYEPYDTKLSRETKAGAVLQLCLYSELLDAAQGLRPEWLHVVPPGTNFKPDSHRVADYFAYYSLVKRRLEAAADSPLPRSLPVPSYPEPVAGCEVCRWRVPCDQRRREDDHLSLVANCSRSQRTEFVENKVSTLASLAAAPLPIPWKPKRGTKETLGRAREQARIQHQGRTTGKALHELLPVEAGRGLTLLPEPSQADLFFDFEGDPFVAFGDGSRANGLEYLFGYSFAQADGPPIYKADWCLNFEEERATFEAFVDWLMARWSAQPKMHVYHYAPYEPTAMKRLMGRYGTKEDEVDQMLRGRLFVDLYSVIRQGLRASVESYSIKKLEPLYGFNRTVELQLAGSSRRKVEHALELGKKVELDDATRREVEGYNKDDCVSAWRLRDWLETLRTKAGNIPRPAAVAPELGDKGQEGREAHKPVREALRQGIPADVLQQTPEQRAKLLLSHLIDFHWRESKGTWWELFRLKDVPDDDLLDERAAVVELTYDSEVARPSKNKRKLLPLHRYRFPHQETQDGEGCEAWAPAEFGELKRIGTVDRIDGSVGEIDIQKSATSQAVHPTKVFLHQHIGTEIIEDSLLRFAQSVVAQGTTAGHPHRAALGLLLKEEPRLRGGGGGPLLQPGEDPVTGASRIALAMDQSVLAVQGPPGTGKSYTGAEVICRLVEAGKKVGVTAVSHSVIVGLLEKATRRAKEMGITLRAGHKDSVNDDQAAVREFKSAGDALDALKAGEIQVLGGTAWLWAGPAAVGALDYLVIDEAGQLSLANALAVGPAAKNLILLGDHKQLDQPQKVTHPEGSDISALEHLLGTESAISPTRGIFLEKTRRLHPAICAFTSELFYGGRLHSLEGLQLQKLVSTSPLSSAGLWFLPVTHEGNKNHAPEEVAAVESLVKSLLQPGGQWVDKLGATHPLDASCIEVVAPYNVQVAALTERLPGVRVGTVDKFQGTEAPVVIISMTSSSAAEAPRGMEFLYSPKRFNVATSRAQCACIVVASPTLFEAECNTPQQMKLANAFCRYLEMARPLAGC